MKSLLMFADNFSWEYPSSTSAVLNRAVISIAPPSVIEVMTLVPKARTNARYKALLVSEE